MISSLLKYIINFYNIDLIMTHYGLLLLFPIDNQYDYIVEKHFPILFKKKINITLREFQDLFTLDSRHEDRVIRKRSKENIGDGNLIFFIFKAQSMEYVNDFLKKKARREIDNIRFEKTGIDRKQLPMQNHLHTTDTLTQLIDSVNYLKQKNKINNDEYIKIRKIYLTI